MILIDFSSIIHRMIHVSVASAKPSKVNGKYVTSEFIDLVKYFILQDLFNTSKTHSTNFGDMYICLDNSVNGYWRKDVYAGYKASRKTGRDESEIDYGEVFVGVNELIDQIRENLPWKVLSVPRAEADDIMLVLAREYCVSEKILIHSPDKDMIQAQRETDNVFQYSALTKKWLTGDTKSEGMTAWIQEHCILGDAGDEVPKVVDHTEFSDVFLTFLNENGFGDIKSPIEFKEHSSAETERMDLIRDFDIFKLKRNGESTGIKDIYKQIRFGPSTLKKKIKEFGTVEKWLDSHPLYKQHYERNFILVMEEGIPNNIKENILIDFKSARDDYNDIAFTDYLNRNGLKSIVMELPSIFKLTRSLTAADFNW